MTRDAGSNPGAPIDRRTAAILRTLASHIESLAFMVPAVNDTRDELPRIIKECRIITRHLLAPAGITEGEAHDDAHE